MVSTSIRYLAYASKSTLPYRFKNNVLVDIQTQSIQQNTKHGITGFLFCKDGKFFQYLEGDAKSLTQLMTNITQDNRHTKVRILAEGSYTDRLFSWWGMYALNLNDNVFDVVLDERLLAFDVGKWTADDVKSIALSMTNAYLNHYQIEPISSVDATRSKLIDNHKTFLLLQALIGLGLLLVLLFYAFRFY